MNALAPTYLKVDKNSSNFNVDILDDAVEEGDTNGMRDWFTALSQIEEQGYAKPYESDKRKLFKIGVNFSTKERKIIEWEVKTKN